MFDRSSSTSTDRSSASSNNRSLSLTEDVSFPQEPWFVGPMSREEAVFRLQSSEPNTFLVRRSQNRARPGELCISLNDGGRVQHMKIDRSGDPPPYRYFLSDARTFESIEELVHFYALHSLAECFAGLDVRLLRPVDSSSTSLSPLSQSPASAPSLRRQ